MATIYKSTEVTLGTPARFVEKGVFASVGTYSITGSTLVINDVIQMVAVPLGAKILRIDLYTSDLDSGATPAVTLDIGDGGSTARFVSASTTGQAAGMISYPAATGSVLSTFPFQYTAAILGTSVLSDTIDILIHAAPQTTATTFNFLMVVWMMVDN